METTFEMEMKRMLKAQAMLEHGVSYTSKGNGVYYVNSQSNPYKKHTVTHFEGKWCCSCEDRNHHHKLMCKHVWLVILTIEKESKEKKVKVLEPIENAECPKCHSMNIKKDGMRHNKYGNLQRYECLDCGKRFSINTGFERMKHNPKAIVAAMNLYFSGESLRNTQRSLKMFGTDVCHKTISNWITKYVNLMKVYVDSLRPNVGDNWRADEVYIRMQGDIKYLFALLDDETRFIIAQEVAETKDKHDACELFRQGQEIAGKKPKLLVTDGLPSYQAAYNKVYRSADNKHLNTIRLTGEHNNNKMERVNGEIRDREKTMRGLKKRDTAILPGYQIYHNYIRPHESLDGKTPAEACGIKVNGENKWITLIENASKAV
jgi:transposase-like protein